MAPAKKNVGCCYGDCPTVLIEIGLGQASVIEPHAICGHCRTIILCASHFESLSGAPGGFVCPECSSGQWEVVPDEEASAEPELNDFGCRPVYAHAYESSTRLLSGGVTVHSAQNGARLRVLGSALDVSVKGDVLDATLSSSGERLAVVCETDGERILEVHTDTGRPWRLRSDEPLGVDSVAFIDENRLVALQTRHEGSLELVELKLESGHLVSGRRLCVASASMPPPSRSLLAVKDGEQVMVVTRSGPQYWLDTFQMTTGKLTQRIKLSYLPSHILVGPEGHVFIGRTDGPVSIVKGEQVVELFTHYDLLDAVFTQDGHLCISTSSQALRIELDSGASTERHWGHAVLGLITSSVAR